jgi:hypothetical protein
MLQAWMVKMRRSRGGRETSQALLLRIFDVKAICQFMVQIRQIQFKG